MPRTSPIYYIAPSAISIIINANGLASDIAVNISEGAKIKVYYPDISALGMDATFRQWTLTGRNRRLADSTKPYTVYARLSKADNSAYLVFAAKILVDGKWEDPYVLSPNVSSESSMDSTDAKGRKITWPPIPVAQTENNRQDFWWIKIGDISEVAAGVRTADIDTGILGTDQFNTEWELNPDNLPLRIILGCAIDGDDAGPTPYIYWGKSATLSASLVEGWEDTDVDRFDHWEITRNSGDPDADADWLSEERASAFGESGEISLSHARGAGDDFNGAVSSTFTIVAWGRENDDDSTESSSEPEPAELVQIASASINIMAETVEKYELVLSTDIVSYDPRSERYTPDDGVEVRILAIDQRGYAFKLTRGQFVNAGLVAEYSRVGTDAWFPMEFYGGQEEEAVAYIRNNIFAVYQSVNVRLLRVVGIGEEQSYSELSRSTIAFVRDGEDSKEREWIYRLNNNEGYDNTAENRGKQFQDDDFVPIGWTDDPVGVTSPGDTEYASWRDYDQENGAWGSFNSPIEWAHRGEDGPGPEVFYQYNVDFGAYVDVITVDDAGNVIGGLYKIDPETQEKYDFRINSAMQVRKNGTLLTQVASREYNTDGTFVVYAEPVGCTCEIRNSTIYITSITNVKDGVAGSGDDDDFDYDAMRLVRNCYVNLLFDCEGRTTFTKQFPITIEHDSEPFVGADLDNEHSGVSWITRTQSYIGLPSFNMKMWRNNEALNIASVNDTSVRTDTQGVTLILRNTTVPPVTIVPDRIYYYKTIVNGQLHVQITAIGSDIPLIVNLNVTASVEYAGVSYERTLVHTITKTTDTNVYSLLPSPTEVIDDGTSLSVSAVDCAVVCDSSDDNHYNVPFSDFATHKIVVQYRFIYANGQQGAMTTYNGSPVQVSRNDNIARVEWFLYGRLTTGLPDTTVEHDREGVPVVKNGDSVYTWIKYADSVGGSGYPSVMYDAPTADTAYIGIAHNKQIPTESSIPSDYEWAKIKGNDGTSFTPKGQVILHYVSRSAMEQDVQQPAQGDYYLCDGDATTPAARATYYRGSWQYDTSASQGDAYVTTDGVQEGHIWVLDGYSWVDLGKIQGPQGPQGPQGLSGCHERLFVGYEPGHEYFNQEDDNTTGVRYVDFIAIENATMASGYSVYMCKTTHTGAVTWTADNTSENWEEVSINAQSAYFRFLITDAVFAKMAHFGAMIIDANWMLTTYGTLYRPATGESWRIDANHSAENVPIGISGGVEILRTYTPDNVCEKFDANYPNRQGYPSGTPSQEDVLYYYNFVPTSAKNMLTGAAYEGEMHIEGYIRSKGLMLNVEYWNKYTHYGDFDPNPYYTPISGDVDELLFAPGTYQDPAHEYRNNLRLPLPWECPGKKFRFVNNMPYDATKVGYGNPTCYIRIGQPLDAEEWYGITDFFTLDGDWINQKVEEYSEEGENPMVKPDPGLYYDDSSSTIKIGEPIIPIIEIAGRNMTNNNRGGTVTIVNNGNTPGVTDNMTLNNVRSFSLYALPLPEAHDTHQRYWHWLLYDIEWYNE